MLIKTKGAKWKFKCPVGVAYLPLPVIQKQILTIPMDRVKPDEIECSGVETIMKFSL